MVTEAQRKANDGIAKSGWHKHRWRSPEKTREAVDPNTREGRSGVLYKVTEAYAKKTLQRLEFFADKRLRTQDEINQAIEEHGYVGPSREPLLLDKQYLVLRHYFEIVGET